MPPRSKAQAQPSVSDGSGGQTIVPLGELVKTLGYSLDWSQKGCFLIRSTGCFSLLGNGGRLSTDPGGGSFGIDLQNSKIGKGRCWRTPR